MPQLQGREAAGQRNPRGSEARGPRFLTGAEDHFHLAGHRHPGPYGPAGTCGGLMAA